MDVVSADVERKTLMMPRDWIIDAKLFYFSLWPIMKKISGNDVG